MKARPASAANNFERTISKCSMVNKELHDGPFFELYEAKEVRNVVCTSAALQRENA